MNKPMTKKEWLAFLKKTIEEFDWDAEHSEKPIAWTDEDFTQLIVSEDIAKDIGATVPLYASPPKRKPLTDEEIILIVAECAASHQHTDIHFARAIERAHGIKGEA